MVARVTLAEIDTVRMSVDDAVELFESRLFPRCASRTATRARTCSRRPEGKALVLTFWATRRPRQRAVDSGLLRGAGREVRDDLRAAARPRDLRRRGRRRPAPASRRGGGDMSRLFGIPIGPAGASSSSPCSSSRWARSSRSRCATASSSGSASATSRRRRGPERSDRRRAHARHGDHRRRARHRRHDEPHDPLLGHVRARADRRGRGGARDVDEALAARAGRQRGTRATSPRATRGRIAARGAAIGARRRRRAGDRRADRRAQDATSRQNEPRVTLFASDPAAHAAASARSAAAATTVSLAALAPGRGLSERQSRRRARTRRAGDTTAAPRRATQPRTVPCAGDRPLRRRRHGRRRRC